MPDLRTPHTLGGGRLLILVDQDGVLADFEAGHDTAMLSLDPGIPLRTAAQRATFRSPDAYSADWHAAAKAVKRAPGFFAGLPAIPGGKDALEAMLEAGHEVFICTSPLSAYENCVGEKYAWVEQHLGREWTRRMMPAKDKTLVRGDVLIDDNPDISGLLTPTWTHVIFDAPYNRAAAGPRLARWSHWDRVLGQLLPGA